MQKRRGMKFGKVNVENDAMNLYALKAMNKMSKKRIQWQLKLTRHFVEKRKALEAGDISMQVEVLRLKKQLLENERE